MEAALQSPIMTAESTKDAVDAVVQAYLEAGGEPLAALRAAVRDVLADIEEKERRLATADR
jgi:hypothetical protein